MTAWVASVFLLGSLQSPPLELHRGVGLDGLQTRYWDVVDTTLDSKEPDTCLGTLPYLLGGQGRTILIRFGDLRRALGPGKEVVAASIVLTQSAGNIPSLQRASVLNGPWLEGSSQSLAPWMAPPSAPDKTPQPTPGANWRYRVAGKSAVGWQQPGAGGAGDGSILEGAQASLREGQFVIAGLEGAVQRWYEAPYANHGIALHFENNVEFRSSHAPNGRPILRLTTREKPPAPGPDIAVVGLYAETTVPRPQLGTPHVAAQDGESIAYRTALPSAESGWPIPGQTVRYRAKVRNIGTEVAAGFDVVWSKQFRSGGTSSFSGELRPGEETELTFETPFQGDPFDPRTTPIGVVVSPKVGDANPANNAAATYEAALSVKVRLHSSVVDKVGRKVNLLGSQAVEDWVHSQVALFNDTFLAQSRFSFAADGAKARVRVQGIEVFGGDGAAATSFEADPADPSLDGVVTLGPEFDPQTLDADRSFLRLLCGAIGLVAFESSRLRAQGPDAVVNGLPDNVQRGGADRFAGLLGWGDTRNESSLPQQLSLLYDPVADPIADTLFIEPTDLLSATEVGGLQSNLGFRGTDPGAYLFGVPTVVMLRLRDLSGQPIGKAEVEVYPMAGGKIDTSSPPAKLTTSEDGVALLPKRPTQAPENYKSPSGHKAIDSLFGRIDPLGSNSALLVKAAKNGTTDYGYLKVWQFVDAYRRSGVGVAFLELRLNLGSASDVENYAASGLLSDSANGLPAQLHALVDGDPTTAHRLPGEGGWVQIDLGRDRSIAEIQLLAPADGSWESFDIVTYATGQLPIEAQVWATERDFSWTRDNRYLLEPNGARAISYRAKVRRFRFLRILNRGGQPGQLAEIRAFGPQV
ncbi:MAG: hypothetical protein AMXMBFR19_13600 [Chthonomonadaceae bacterium]|uniref:F5/8 type C domain-containing protein n=1 Tax=Candidatus Nitrosymbiomonas proteolyticus TaxID=2608984 RepID=A0A809R7S2_9BACT|nr:conserved hypothetical protein [Candidatus Nitrosymbiomonas proteolyticus]